MANNDRGQSLISKYAWVIETIYRAKKISFKELLWNGGDVEVLEPASLRREMADMIERMWNKYKNDKK